MREGRGTVRSDQVAHQSGSSDKDEEDEEDEEEKEGKLENTSMEGAGGVLWANVVAEAIIAFCGIHTSINTWVIHHP